MGLKAQICCVRLLLAAPVCSAFKHKMLSDEDREGCGFIVMDAEACAACGFMPVALKPTTFDLVKYENRHFLKWMVCQRSLPWAVWPLGRGVRGSAAPMSTMGCCRHGANVTT